MKKLLIPVDFSSESEEALHHVLQCSCATTKSITLLHVLDPSDVTSLGLVGMEEYEETLRERLLADANDRLDQLVKRYSSNGIEMIAITSVDKPWRGIIQTALDQQVDAIVISSHGKGMVKQTLLGSTAEKIVRKAPVTVIVVKPQHIKDKLRKYWQQIGKD